MLSRDAAVVGTTLRKLDIAVHFFQVYALLLFMAARVQWPDQWASAKAAYDWPPFLAILELRNMFALAGTSQLKEAYEVNWTCAMCSYTLHSRRAL